MYTYRYPHPAVTADCVVFAEENGRTKLLLIERQSDPYKGCWAFPGGFMNIDETAEDAALRELAEETGIRITHAVQVGAFSAVDRDPRERVLTIVYYARLTTPIRPTAADDARQAQWFDLSDLPPLAFDHANILRQACRLAGVDLPENPKEVTVK